ncbi:Amuc_1100 family pilus-like protein [Luteolibacter arcticus]|uniref:Amuc_1100 family pilus-like protein n=1 Tax=Luteolibacter arcticus TaxID=1581411 RepID=A0ABT3GH51_9BACT|nr:Amuc_1100 family pilus-like protein [Luteolibacter arcticus]MCW1922946.1 Amuc_1100 family pilus-like protein [Luteolibacter arcticus]
MSWIQENKFAAGLGGITAVAAAGLIFWGVKASGDYTAAKDEYTTAADEVEKMAQAKVYPSEANLQAKKKAVTDYEKSVGDMQKAFDKFRAPTPPNVDPAAFSDTLLKAKDVAKKAFDEVRPQATELPGEFFLGLEAYTTSPPERGATGILTYQLEALSELMANLAAAGPTKLINIHRPQLEEESGKPFDAKGKSYRALPVEVSFYGNEASLRKFVSSLDDSKAHYYVVRSIRVINEKAKAPTAADGNFETGEDEAKPEGGAAADPFGGAGGAGGFVLPGDEPAAPPADGAAPAPAGAPAAAPADAAAPAAGGDGVILQQVLGSEKLNVFLRIDIIQFLEAPVDAKKASVEAKKATVEAQKP